MYTRNHLSQQTSWAYPASSKTTRQLTSSSGFAVAEHLNVTSSYSLTCAESMATDTSGGYLTCSVSAAACGSSSASFLARHVMLAPLWRASGSSRMPFAGGVFC